MTPKPGKRKTRNATRAPLDRAQILDAALALADAEGIETLSMRRLGQRLGVEAMSLYNHVANKEQVLAGMLDRVLDEVDLRTTKGTWRDAMRVRARSMRRIFHRHPWAVGLLESTREPGPATLRYCDAVLGILRKGGFSVPRAAAAFYQLDSYIYGSVIQEKRFASAAPGEVAAETEVFLQELSAEACPHLAEVAAHFVATGFDHDQNFETGLDLVLEALEAWRDEA